MRSGMYVYLSASTFDITARAIRAATKSRGSYNGRAQIVANLQTMPTTTAQRTDLPDIAFDDGDSRSAGADVLPVTARGADKDRR
jgi:hypothetical protein